MSIEPVRTTDPVDDVAPRGTPVEMLTTNQLAAELVARCDTVVLAVRRIHGGMNHPIMMTVKGDVLVVRGLVSTLEKAT